MKMKMIPSPELPPRNRRKEDKERDTKLGSAMKAIARARMTGSELELLQVGQVLVVFGLPYTRTAAREVVRETRDAEGRPFRVIFHAFKKGVDLPFGTDRNLLHWIANQAVLRKSPFIPLSSGRQYLHDIGYAVNGQNLLRVQEAFQRISGFAIIVQREGVRNRNTIITPVFRESNLPKTLAKIIDAEPAANLRRIDPFIDNMEPGIRLDEDVFREFLNHHVPTYKSLIEATRKSPKMQDYMLFMQWRSFAAKTQTLIPWEAVSRQFPSEDSNPWRFRALFEHAIKALVIAWPELCAEAHPEGLAIGPPFRNRQLLPDGEFRRRFTD